MFFKIMATAILLVEIINPKFFWDIKESFVYNKSPLPKNYFKVTRIMSALAILIVWIFF